jgi:phosphoribosyl-AMP cyclohydrolase
MSVVDRLKFDGNGLVPVVVQDAGNEQVLMVAYMNREAVERTLATGKATYWSRSRQEFWVKGATSGHFQYVQEMLVDCDGDCLLIKVEQVGAACHTGCRSCFFRAANDAGEWVTVAEPIVDATP